MGADREDGGEEGWEGHAGAEFEGNGVGGEGDGDEEGCAGLFVGGEGGGAGG